MVAAIPATKAIVELRLMVSLSSLLAILRVLESDHDLSVSRPSEAIQRITQLLGVLAARILGLHYSATT
jgi:hypothetical protein